MKAIAILLAALATACFAGSAWLWVKIHTFFHSSEYAPSSAQMLRYTAGNLEADGGGIFAPVMLAFVLGLFLAKFALNLWKGERLLRRADDAHKSRELDPNERRERLRK